MKAVAALLLLLTYSSNCQGWTCKAGPQQSSAAQIDAGQGQVVLTDTSSNAFFLSGQSWSRLGTVSLRHASVGPAGIWGVDILNKVNKFVRGELMLVDGQELQQVDAGGNGQIVGVTSTNTIYCLPSGVASSYQQSCPVTWKNFDGFLKYLSCGPSTCWGVNSAETIFYTTVNSSSCDKTNWTVVPGSSKMVEVGNDGSVFVITSAGNVFQRSGITDSVPQGVDWVQLPICLPAKHISYDLGRLWVVLELGLILKCQP